MSDNINAMAAKRARFLGEGQVGEVLLKLSIPAIFAMLLNGIYNAVDAAFIGRIGTSAIGAVSIAFPIFALIGGVGLTFGQGAASYISRMLGAGKKTEADKTASIAFFSVLAVGITTSIFGVIFIEPLLLLFGATETILVYAVDYTRILILGSSLTMLNMTMNNIARSEGNSKLSMISLVTGAATNIVLDPIFIFLLGLGIQGAAIATVLSQAVSFILLFRYFKTRSSYVHLRPSLFSFNPTVYAEIFKIGGPTFIRQFLASFGMALMNSAARPYGDAAVAALGIAMRFIMLGIFPIFGFGQGFQPLAGYSFGAKKFDRLFQAVKTSYKNTTILALIYGTLTFLFPEIIVGVFSSDPEVIRIGSMTLRAFGIVFPTVGFHVITAVLFQAIGKGLPAGVLSLSRQGIFLLPILAVFPRLFGLPGVLYSQPAADVGTAILTAVLAVWILRKLQRMEK